MGVTMVLGAQWGDEGKGRVVDYLAKNAHMTVRFQGGNNAGHTQVIGSRKIPLHLCPAGILRKGTTNIVGPLVAWNLEVGLNELALVKEFDSRIVLDRSAPVVLPIHVLIDALRECVAGKEAIGTTLRGIGPTYGDLWLRRGLKLGDITSRTKMQNVLTEAGYWKELNALCQHLGGKQSESDDLTKLGIDIDPMSLRDTVNYCDRYTEVTIPHLGDTRQEVHRALRKGQNILAETAHGVILDPIHGSRRFSTSSFCTPASFCASYGIYTFDRVIAVAKAYTTRVGHGPFPTEEQNEIGVWLRGRGTEYGTTTGRPRRCGWPDLRILDYACRVSGATELVITKLDVLSGIPELKVCTQYTGVDPDTSLTGEILENVVPEYENTIPWTENISSARNLDHLPYGARNYLKMIAQRTGISITGISVGAERESMFWETINP